MVAGQTGGLSNQAREKRMRDIADPEPQKKLKLADSVVLVSKTSTAAETKASPRLWWRDLMAMVEDSSRKRSEGHDGENAPLLTEGQMNQIVQKEVVGHRFKLTMGPETKAAPYKTAAIKRFFTITSRFSGVDAFENVPVQVIRYNEATQECICRPIGIDFGHAL